MPFPRLTVFQGVNLKDPPKGTHLGEEVVIAEEVEEEVEEEVVVATEAEETPLDDYGDENSAHSTS